MSIGKIFQFGKFCRTRFLYAPYLEDACKEYFEK